MNSLSVFRSHFCSVIALVERSYRDSQMKQNTNHQAQRFPLGEPFVVFINKMAFFDLICSFFLGTLVMAWYQCCLWCNILPSQYKTLIWSFLPYFRKVCFNRSWVKQIIADVTWSVSMKLIISLIFSVPIFAPSVKEARPSFGFSTKLSTGRGFVGTNYISATPLFTR